MPGDLFYCLTSPAAILGKLICYNWVLMFIDSSVDAEKEKNPS